MTMESDAIESEVLRLMANFLFSATDTQIDAYIAALAIYSPKAVKQAVDRLIDGQVQRNHEFMPKAPEVAIQARMFHEIEQRLNGEAAEKLVSYPIGAPVPEGYVPLGPLEVDAGHGKIDLRGLSHADKEFVLRHHRLPPRKDEQQRVGFTPKFQRA
jgi:hypothetical protein